MRWGWRSTRISVCGEERRAKSELRIANCESSELFSLVIASAVREASRLLVEDCLPLRGLQIGLNGYLARTSERGAGF